MRLSIQRKLMAVACVALSLLLAAGCTRPSPDASVIPSPAATATTPPAGTLTPTPVATPVLPAPASVVPPAAPASDLFQIARMLRRLPAPIPPLPLLETNHAPGRTDAFNVVDFNLRRVSSIDAELRVVSTSAYLYVEKGVNLSQSSLERSAMELETNILPALQRYINPAWKPGWGVDSRVTIVHTKLAGASGYMTSLDLLPRDIYPYSNQRPVVFMSVFAANPGTDHYYQVLAHELQHEAHAQSAPHQETWVQEGLAELFSELAGYKPNLQQSFLANPDTHLINWDTPGNQAARHYGAAYMFLKYLGGQVGYEELPWLAGAKSPGMGGVAELLRHSGDNRSPEQVLRDWTVANAVDRGSTAGRFAYPAPAPPIVHVPTQAVAIGRHEGTVAQYAAAYAMIDAAPTPRDINFDGSDTVPLLPTTPTSGRTFWWSNRGDSIAASLTRGFDLSRTARATLAYKLWFDIEDQYDYAFVLASGDGGTTWDILSGRFSTTRNDMGQSFGAAYTGASGSSAGWVDESVDLTPYAGGQVLVRFLYVTDEGKNHAGLSLDDVAIPEIGFVDDAETDAGWRTEGFARTENRASQAFFVSLILKGTGEVLEAGLDTQNRGRIRIPAGEQGVLVITALAPLTSVRAQFEYTVVPVG